MPINSTSQIQRSYKQLSSSIHILSQTPSTSDPSVALAVPQFPPNYGIPRPPQQSLPEKEIGLQMNLV